MKKETTQGRGGARPNCGRKPIADKKQNVTVFIPASVIKKNGGIEKLKTKILKTYVHV
jgi:hypothetical protein